MRAALEPIGRGNTEIVFFIDADIQLSTNPLRATAHALGVHGEGLAQPSRCCEPDAGFVSKLAGQALCTLPRVADDVVCGGIFAVNRAGCARGQEFSDRAADDAFVFNRSSAQERMVVGDAVVTHPMPTPIRGLARQQPRWRVARYELSQLGGSPTRSPDRVQKWPVARRVRSSLRSPRVRWAVSLLRLIRLASILDRIPSRSHAWNVEQRWQRSVSAGYENIEAS